MRNNEQTANFRELGIIYSCASYSVRVSGRKHKSAHWLTKHDTLGFYTHALALLVKLHCHYVRYGTGWHVESRHEALDSNSLASIGQDVGTKCALLQVSCGGCEFYVQEGTLYRRGQACNPSACTGQW